MSRYRATFVSILTILPALLTSSLQAGSFGPIEDHYFGATLFIAPTGNVVWPPVAVSNLNDYVSTYGPVDGTGTDHGLEAARLFFANGGEKLFVIDPHGIEVSNFADALAASSDLPVDLVAMPGAACCQSPAMHADIMNTLIDHVDVSPNRFGLISAPQESNTAQLVDFSAYLTSDHSALFVPWLTVTNNDSSILSTISPVAAVAGVISRIDRDFRIFKNPAGLDTVLADPPGTALERDLSGDQDELNPLGINLIREFGDPPSLYIWGARTLTENTSRPSIAFARFMRHLEFSITQSLGWISNLAPGELNPQIVEILINDYLYAYYLTGTFQGIWPDSYFVSCSSEPPWFSCWVGVALVIEAEYDVFRVRIPYRDDIFLSRFESSHAPYSEQGHDSRHHLTRWRADNDERQTVNEQQE